MFTYFLLKGLRGEADNGDKIVTVSELHNYVMKNVEDTTKTLYKDLPQNHYFILLIQIEYYINSHKIQVLNLNANS